MTPASEAAARERTPSAVLGMVLFVASEVMFFGALFGAYYTLRARAAVWPPEGSPEIELLRPGVLTALLLSSSFTQHRALHALRADDRRGLTRWLAATIALGALFLGGEAWEWRDLIGSGFTAATNVFGTLFFTITGFHGLHLIGGLVILALALAKAASSRYRHQRLGSMEAATFYWHFVDVVWVFVFSSLYLLNA